MKTLEQLRAREAQALSKFYAGETDVHPHGLSGKRAILPSHLATDCRDTARHAFEFSEWGNLAGFSGIQFGWSA